eukprot:jgi/Botrbrau1/11515/Bobra.0198s0012.1
MRVEMVSSVDFDEVMKETASAVLRVVDVGSTVGLPQACIDRLHNVFGSESLRYCRIAATLRHSVRHMYLAACGNIALNCLDTIILKCPKRLFQKVVEKGYLIDTFAPATPTWTRRGSELHSVFHALHKEGASVIISVLYWQQLNADFRTLLLDS